MSPDRAEQEAQGPDPIVDRETENRARVATIEWDRGSERIDGIILAHSNDGIVLHKMFDLEIVGAMWIRSDEVTSIEYKDRTSLEHRIAVARDYTSRTFSSALTSLPSLLTWLQEKDELAMYYRPFLGSRAGLAGWVNGIRPESFALLEVSTDAEISDTSVDLPLEDVLAVSWADPYLTGLRDLSLMEPTTEPDRDS